MIKRELLQNTLLVIASLMVMILLSEVVLRDRGHRPFSARLVDRNEPTMFEPHSAYGWRSIVGSYIIPPYTPAGSEILVSFDAPGRRFSGGQYEPNNPSIMLIGGSFTQGAAVSDHQTFAWKIQQQFANTNILNYGTGGYGTYQSLLVLEDELPKAPSTKTVVYGLFDHHEDRNVATANWLASLVSLQNRGHINVPFVELTESGELIRHAPQGYLRLPFRESLATVTALERLVMKIRTRGRDTDKSIITEKLILQMRTLADKHDATLIVAILAIEPQNRPRYRKFFEDNNIAYIDVAFPITKDMRVLGEGHPNGAMHSLWAESLAKFLRNHSN